MPASKCENYLRKRCTTRMRTMESEKKAKKKAESVKITDYFGHLDKVVVSDTGLKNK